MRIDPRDRVSAEQARSFALAAWEAAGDQLARRHPGRVFRLRHWRGSWEVTAGRVRRRDTRHVVREIVRLCEALPLSGVGQPPAPDVAGVSFADEPARVAAWWSSLRSPAAGHWAWRDLAEAPGPVDVLAALPAGERRGVLDRLDAGGALPGAVRALGRHERRRLAELVGPGAARPPGAGTSAADPPAAQHQGARAERARPERDPPGPDALAATLAEQVRAWRGSRPLPPVRPGPRPDRPREAPARGPGSARAAPRTGAQAARPAAPVAGPAGPPGRGGLVAVHRSQWLGLVYLLRPALRCGVGEALWMACLDEARVIGAAWRALCGDDPAVRQLTGGGPAGELPPVSPEHVAAVGRHVLPRLAAALAGAGAPLAAALASDGPTTGLQLAGSPWPAMAWHDASPATCAGEVLAAGLPRPSAASTPAWFPGARDPVERALLAIVLGAPATLLDASCGAPERSVEASAARWLRVEGTITDDGETLWVQLPAAAIDLTLRRAGGDADPGWIPWLGRTVRIRYDVGEPG